MRRHQHRRGCMHHLAASPRSHANNSCFMPWHAYNVSPFSSKVSATSASAQTLTSTIRIDPQGPIRLGREGKGRVLCSLGESEAPPLVFSRGAVSRMMTVQELLHDFQRETLYETYHHNTEISP